MDSQGEEARPNRGSPLASSEMRASQSGGRTENTRAPHEKIRGAESHTQRRRSLVDHDEPRDQSREQTETHRGLRGRSRARSTSSDRIPTTEESDHTSRMDSDFQYISEISTTLREINRIVDLKWLANRLKQLHQKLKPGKSTLDYVLALNEFNEDNNQRNG